MTPIDLDTYHYNSDIILKVVKKLIDDNSLIFKTISTCKIDDFYIPKLCKFETCLGSTINRCIIPLPKDTSMQNKLRMLVGIILDIRNMQKVGGISNEWLLHYSISFDADNISMIPHIEQWSHKDLLKLLVAIYFYTYKYINKMLLLHIGACDPLEKDRIESMDRGNRPAYITELSNYLTNISNTITDEMINSIIKIIEDNKVVY
jgi:hypothetical protein